MLFLCIANERGFLVKIIIVSEFCGDFSQNDNNRFLYLAKKIVRDVPGANVEIVTSSFHHTIKDHRKNKVNDWPFKITYIYEPGYSKNICLKRFYSHYIWGRNVKKYIESIKSPDVIYCAVPSLTGAKYIASYCKKNNVRFVIDIQDLWPEAFRMIINIPIISDIIFFPFEMIANNIYKSADVICAVSDTYANRALKVNKVSKVGNVVFLGTELMTFDKYASERSIINKHKGEIWIAYCGTLGSSYDLTCVIDALFYLNDDRVRFIVMGDGPKMNHFKEYALKKSVKAEFLGRLKYNQMCSILTNCDIAVNPIMHMAAQSIINKHADYAAAGIPVVSTQENEEYRNLVKSYRMGYNVNNNDADDLSSKLRILIDNDEIRMKMGLNSRRCAEEKFDRENTYNLLIESILGD